MKREVNYCLIVLSAIVFSNAGWGAQSGAVTLAAGTSLNLDTAEVSTSGGDILWSGSAVLPQGRAGLYNLGKSGERIFKSIRARHAAAAPYSFAPIPADKLAVGDIFGVRTNSGKYAKLIVTAASRVSLSLQYTTFLVGASTLGAAAATGPAITQIQNNYSWILPGLPNYGIAPGSIFIIIGTGLSSAAPPVLQSSNAPGGLPTTLNQTSVSVTVKGVTTSPAFVYTSATQIAAILPSTTPVGNGTITVTYNGQASAPAPIQVVASAVGLDSSYGTGNGLGVITDSNYKPFDAANSAMPGQPVILWGSGIGADPSNDDRTFPQKQNNLTNIPIQVYIGGISANVLYSGRSQYPGLDQYNVVVPSNVSPGCFVSVVVQTGSVVSNTVTLPVNPGGGACSDPGSGLSGTQLQSLANKNTVNSAGVAIVSGTDPDGTGSVSAFVLPGVLSGANYGKGYEYASQGSCALVPPEQGSIKNFFLGVLDAGSIQLAGPAGQFTIGSGPRPSQAQLSQTPAVAPGTYTFTASGGADVGSFSVSVNVQAPFALTNKASFATMTRSQGATVTWSGGYPNGDVQVEAAVGDQYGSVRFFCHVPSNAGQLVIPPSILLAMPPGTGSLTVTNTSVPQPVSASGVDVGLAIAQSYFKLNVALQ
jgi:uncharacterized protein (TIGR03437 family)